MMKDHIASSEEATCKGTPIPGYIRPKRKNTRPVRVVALFKPYDGSTEHIVLQLEPPAVHLTVDKVTHKYELNGVSVAEDNSLATFYQRDVKSLVESVRGGCRRTILMYGPTCSGKSYNMFGDNGSSKKGIALQTLEHLFSGEDELLPGTQSSRNVKVSILEIQGENTYDLVKQQGQRRLKMKPGAKGATLQGSNVLVLYPQIDNVVKRRHSQPTKCNASSSRSHCMVIIEVSEGGGCLVLVDMAGSENIEEAGTGVHSASRRQTGDINKDSSLLKRVMIALAEGATHVPYRESELTMRLKASFEAGAQVLMVLCASQEAAEVHKTKSTLDFGALAKSITRFQETAAVEELKEAHGTLEPRERARLRQLEEANQEQEVEIKALRSKMHGWDHSMADMQAFIRRHSQQDAELNAERQKNALLEVEVLRLQRALADSGRGGSSPSRSRSRSTLVQLEPNTLTGECTPSGQKQQPQEQAQQHSAGKLASGAAVTAGTAPAGAWSLAGWRHNSPIGGTPSCSPIQAMGSYLPVIEEEASAPPSRTSHAFAACSSGTSPTRTPGTPGLRSGLGTGGSPSLYRDALLLGLHRKRTPSASPAGDQMAVAPGSCSPAWTTPPPASAAGSGQGHPAPAPGSGGGGSGSGAGAARRAGISSIFRLCGAPREAASLPPQSPRIHASMSVADAAAGGATSSPLDSSRQVQGQLALAAAARSSSTHALPHSVLTHAGTTRSSPAAATGTPASAAASRTALRSPCASRSPNAASGLAHSQDLNPGCAQNLSAPADCAHTITTGARAGASASWTMRGAACDIGPDEPAARSPHVRNAQVAPCGSPSAAPDVPGSSAVCAPAHAARSTPRQSPRHEERASRRALPGHGSAPPPPGGTPRRFSPPSPLTSTPLSALPLPPPAPSSRPLPQTSSSAPPPHSSSPQHRPLPPTSPLPLPPRALAPSLLPSSSPTPPLPPRSSFSPFPAPPLSPPLPPSPSPSPPSLPQPLSRPPISPSPPPRISPHLLHYNLVAPPLPLSLPLPYEHHLGPARLSPSNPPLPAAKARSPDAVECDPQCQRWAAAPAEPSPASGATSVLSLPFPHVLPGSHRPAQVEPMCNAQVAFRRPESDGPPHRTLASSFREIVNHTTPSPVRKHSVKTPPSGVEEGARRGPQGSPCLTRETGGQDRSKPTSPSSRRCRPGLPEPAAAPPCEPSQGGEAVSMSMESSTTPLPRAGAKPKPRTKRLDELVSPPSSTRPHHQQGGTAVHVQWRPLDREDLPQLRSLRVIPEMTLAELRRQLCKVLPVEYQCFLFCKDQLKLWELEAEADVKVHNLPRNENNEHEVVAGLRLPEESPSRAAPISMPQRRRGMMGRLLVPSEGANNSTRSRRSKKQQPSSFRREAEAAYLRDLTYKARN